MAAVVGENVHREGFTGMLQQIHGQFAGPFFARANRAGMVNAWLNSPPEPSSQVLL
jgi:hypothetical protein